MYIDNGIITAGNLRKLISELKDEEPILIMCDDGETTVGYNASVIEYYPPREDREECELYDEPWEATIYLTF